MQTFVGPFSQAIQSWSGLHVDLLISLAVLLPVLIKALVHHWGASGA